MVPPRALHECRIREDAVRDARPSGEGVLPGFARLNEMDDAPASHAERIGDDAPVATPEKALRAQNGGGRLACQSLELDHTGGALCRAQVVGVVAERRLEPSCIRGV